MKRLPRVPAVILAVSILLARTARAETGGTQLVPRLTLIELDYPQIVAASVGLWVMGTGSGSQPGLLAEVQAGLSGPKVALGVGAVSSPSTSYENGYSGGIQAVAHRTWPGWSSFLPPSATYVGVEAFGHFFAFRCSVGVMWRLSGDFFGPSPIPSAGCGIGTP